MNELQQRARGAILGPLVADAAAAGLHWIYDVGEVKERAGDTPEFRPPEENQYHARRTTGRFTHYGDHARVALESLVACGGLDVADYRRRYAAHFGGADYDGYLDHATKDLLATGAGSDDNQAGAFTKLAAVAVRYLEDPEFDARIEEAVRATHDNAQAVRYGVAAAHAIRSAVRGASPAAVLEEAAREPGEVGILARKAAKAGPDHTAYALAAGQNCPVPNGYPVALHVLGSTTSFEEVVREEILAAGDTSGRLFLSAAVAGAAYGVPEAWLARVEGRAQLEEFVSKLVEAS